MDSHDTDVGIGDVVRAWSRLGARTAEERALIAQLLGFDYTFTGRERRPRTRKPDPAAVASAHATPSKAASSDAVAVAAVPVPLSQISAETASPQPSPDWLRIDRPLQPERPEHLDVRPPHEPLFRGGWTRAILSAACATSSPDGPIDIARLIDAIATCRPVTALPRESLLSLGRGIELLVDRSDNLMPFARDIRNLQQQLLLVVGRDRTRIRYFDGSPAHGCGPGARSTWTKRCDPPAPETPIVVITDLGMARGSAARTGATVDAWLRFCQTARSAACPVIVFAPYPQTRWPVALSKAIRAIPWDRPTTVSLARQAALREGDRG